VASPSAGRRDVPYRLLAKAVAAMPPGRRDWGLAMLAELDHIHDPGDRARFALGATRVALFPPGAAPSWWAVPLGLVLRAAVAAVTIHVLAPAVGPAALPLAALPAAGAWGVVTIPALTGRPRGVVPAAQAAVAAGVTGCLVLAVVTVQSYPQVMTSGAHGWGIGVVFDVASAGYLVAALLLSRAAPATERNSWYALAAALVLAAGAACYIASPSLAGLWAGDVPGEYLLASLAVPGAAALAAGRRGRVKDGLETAAWAALLGGLVTSIMIIAATGRVAPAAAASAPIIADARLHGVASAPAWLAGDNLGGAFFALIAAAFIFFAAGAGGAAAGLVLRGLAAGGTARTGR
jgi:hypothetical protein